MKHKFLSLFLSAALSAGFLCGCKGSSASDTGIVGDTLTSEARLLTLVDCGGYLVADVKNPWDSTKLLQRYVLLPDSAGLPENLPDGVLVRVPLKRSLVYSGVHAGAVKELGAIAAVSGVAEGAYFTMPEIREGLDRGSIVDVGSSMSPDVEKVTELNPDAILASPYQNSSYGVVESLGLPIIECADYMEATPLARAEWIRLLGALYGHEAEADSIWRKVSDDYRALASRASEAGSHPKVITERVMNGVWFVPGGRSYMSRLITDAGGVNPWSGTQDSGSVQLDFSSVFDKACDADIWLIRNYGPGLTLSELKSSYELNSRMDAFKSGEVYVADTSTSTLFEDFPFHPEKLLREYILLFLGPDYAGTDTTRYYKRIEP
ncbi:MAG: ABC transporter substrate-binding protein [Duncaniella sp.]|nr:ABC transporter substrate-binding protein [Duncaniella sp.]